MTSGRAEPLVAITGRPQAWVSPVKNDLPRTELAASVGLQLNLNPNVLRAMFGLPKSLQPNLHGSVEN